MSRTHLLCERLAWTAVVIALATSASWLAAINVALFARLGSIEAPEALLVGRALLRAAWLVIRQVGSIVPLALLVPGLIVLFVRTLRHEARVEGEARHA